MTALSQEKISQEFPGYKIHVKKYGFLLQKKHWLMIKTDRQGVCWGLGLKRGPRYPWNKLDVFFKDLKEEMEVFFYTR